MLFIPLDSIPLFRRYFQFLGVNFLISNLGVLYLDVIHVGVLDRIPWRLSQAAACDGNYYQIPQEYAESNPPPGVLPIWKTYGKTIQNYA